MNIHALIPGLGAIFFGLLLTLAAYGVIGRTFTHEDFKKWLERRGSFYRVLGPILILIGVIILVFR